MSYIEREVALQIIDNYAKTVTADGKVVVNAVRDIVGVITPSADVVEVRHGYNKDFDYPSLFECSVCGALDGDTYTGEGEYKYCPWCGAKMDGERSEGDE